MKLSKKQKARIGIMIICVTLLIAFTYIRNLPWWFPVLFLSPGPLIVVIAIIYEKITGKVLK